MRKGIVITTGMALAAAFLIVGQPGFLAGQDDKKATTGQAGAHDEMFRKCADACNDCQRECDACGTHCAKLLAEGKKQHMETLQTCRDCATFCAAAAQIVARNGPFADLICPSCAEACARCAKACEKHADDPMMRRCAEECRRCEKACREMVRHIGRGNGRATVDEAKK